MRQRAAIILIEDQQIALIKRVRNGDTYYVIPGGGVESGETPEEAAVREAREELGVHVEIGSYAFEVMGTGHEYYFMAFITGGEFGKGNGKEFTAAEPDRGSYEAVWIPIGLLPSINVYPEQLVDAISQNSLNLKSPR